MFDAIFEVIGSIARFCLQFIMDCFLWSGGRSMLEVCHRKNGQLPSKCKVLMTLMVVFIIGVFWLVV